MLGSFPKAFSQIALGKMPYGKQPTLCTKSLDIKNVFI